MNETALIGLFVELTGETESAAKCVLFYLEMLEHDYFPNLDALNALTVVGNGAPVERAAGLADPR